MTKEQNRKQMQNASQSIGHCVCSIKFQCPCKYFKDKDVCHCAGEYVDEKTWLKYNCN